MPCRRSTGFVLACIFLAGCTGVATTRLPPPVDDRGIPAGDVRGSSRMGGTGIPAPRAEQVPGVTEQPVAVLALLDHAEQQANSGDLDTAASTLERALRIDPRNSLLWHHLASVRLAQGDAAQTEQLAIKSNSLATGNPALQASNWRLIARARRESGDGQGARSAEQRARALDTP